MHPVGQRLGFCFQCARKGALGEITQSRAGWRGWAGRPEGRHKLTLHTAPQGLRPDGEDVALIDFEVVDASGERCPTDDARVDFTWNSVGRTVSATGPAIWRGGYNSGKTNSTNNLYLNTEGGINRVAMRSTLMPGTITLTARREGLQPATITFDSKPVAITDGLSQEMPQTLSPAARE
jgi:beta-galactosidase